MKSYQLPGFYKRFSGCYSKFRRGNANTDVWNIIMQKSVILLSILIPIKPALKTIWINSELTIRKRIIFFLIWYYWYINFSASWPNLFWIKLMLRCKKIILFKLSILMFLIKILSSRALNACLFIVIIFQMLYISLILVQLNFQSYCTKE